MIIIAKKRLTIAEIAERLEPIAELVKIDGKQVNIRFRACQHILSYLSGYHVAIASSKKGCPICRAEEKKRRTIEKHKKESFFEKRFKLAKAIINRKGFVIETNIDKITNQRITLRCIQCGNTISYSSLSYAAHTDNLKCLHCHPISKNTDWWHNKNPNSLSDNEIERRFNEKYPHLVLLKHGYWNQPSDIEILYPCEHIIKRHSSMKNIVKHLAHDCPICKQKYYNIRNNRKRSIAKFSIFEKWKSRVYKCIERDKQFDIISLFDHKAIIKCKYCNTEKSINKIADIFCNCEQKKIFNYRKRFLLRASKELIDYDIIDIPEHGKQYMKVRHKKCNTVFVTRPFILLHANKVGKTPCPNCMGVKGVKKTNRQVQEELNQRYGKGVYTLISDYTDCEGKVIVRHVCGHEYEITVKHILQGNRKDKYTGCPACSTLTHSRGEKKISSLLEKWNIYYDQEVRMGKTLQRFDFVIHGSARDIYLEYDGAQHYSTVEFWDGEEGLKKTIARDRKKDQFCREHGYLLFRIPYWEYDCLEDILESILMIADDRYCVTLF